MQAIIQECLQAKSQGLTLEDLLRLLRDRGLTITEAMKALMAVEKISLAEAKVIVSSSPVWQEIVEAAQPLHDELTAPSSGEADG
jgi:hypothetical protein